VDRTLRNVRNTFKQRDRRIGARSQKEGNDTGAERVAKKKNKKTIGGGDWEKNLIGGGPKPQGDHVLSKQLRFHLIGRGGLMGKEYGELFWKANTKKGFTSEKTGGLGDHHCY